MNLREYREPNLAILLDKIMEINHRMCTRIHLRDTVRNLQRIGAIISLTINFVLLEVATPVLFSTLDLQFKMSCSCYEWEDVHIKERFLPPHCDTCECGRSELEITRKIVRPVSQHVPRQKLPRPYLPEVITCCPCKGFVDCNLCLCYECRKVRGRSEASLRKKQRGRFYDYKHSLLETWFDR